MRKKIKKKSMLKRYCTRNFCHVNSHLAKKALNSSRIVSCICCFSLSFQSFFFLFFLLFAALCRLLCASIDRKLVSQVNYIFSRCIVCSSLDGPRVCHCPFLKQQILSFSLSSSLYSIARWFFHAIACWCAATTHFFVAPVNGYLLIEKLQKKLTKSVVQHGVQ